MKKLLITIVILCTALQIQPMQRAKEFVKIAATTYIAMNVGNTIGMNYNPTHVEIREKFSKLDRAQEMKERAMAAQAEFDLRSNALNIEFNRTKAEYDRIKKELQNSQSNSNTEN